MTFKTAHFANGDLGYYRPGDSDTLYDVAGCIDEIVTHGLHPYSRDEAAFLLRHAEDCEIEWRRAAANLNGASSATHTAAASAAVWASRADALRKALA